MSDLTHLLRRHIAERRVALQAQFPRSLEQGEYLRLCGRHAELEALASALDEAVKKVNLQESEA